MRFRTAVGTLMFLGVGLLLALDSAFLDRTRPLGSILLASLGLLGWGEYVRIIGIGVPGPRYSAGLSLLGLFSILYFFSVAWAFRASAGAAPALPGAEETWTAAGLYGLVLLAIALGVFRRDFEVHYHAVWETVAGGMLLGWLFSYLLRIYHLPGWEGPVLGAVLVGGVKGNDTAAYYVGKAWGRHRIFKVSPKKTLEGSVGALVFSAIYFGAAAALLEAYRPGSLFPWPGGILFGMMVSIVSQVGDLGESLIKRMYQVKDSGSILPEFGGVLDMIDSLILTGFLFWELR